MADLTVTFGGVEFLSPIGVAAHAPKQPFTPEELSKVFMKYVQAGSAYVHTPVVTAFTSPPVGKGGLFYKSPDWGPTSAGSLQVEGWRLDAGKKLVRILKEKLPRDVRVIANIMGQGAEREDWVRLAEEFQNVGADLIELDISCTLTELSPDVIEALEEKKFPVAAGALLGDTPELVVPIIEEVGKAVSIPVGAKLAPETGFPRLLPIARSLKNIGGWVSAVNAVMTLFTPPDIHNGGKPLFPGIDRNPYGAAWGEWIRYLCYRDVATIAKNIPDLDIAAVGGLTKPSYMVEAMMLGAKLTEISSGLLLKGIGIVRNSTNFLESYLDNYEYHSIENLTGVGLKYVAPWKDVSIADQIAETLPSKCTGCKICVDNLCPAGYMQNSIAMVREDLCTGCGMCVMCCPQGARRLRERTSKQQIASESQVS